MPFGVFWIYFREIDVHEAHARVGELRAVLSAIGLAFAKPGAQLPQAVRDDLTIARLEASR